MSKKKTNLKEILNESIGGIVFPEAVGSPFKDKNPASLVKVAKEILNQNKASVMERDELISSVNEFSNFGKEIYGNRSISEVGQKFVEMAKAAQKHVVDETQDWFDAVTVKRNMSELNKHAQNFNKLASEAQALQDRMSALYEDMGNIYNRYFEIKELNESYKNKLDEASYSLTKASELIGDGDKDEQWEAAVELTGKVVRPTSLKKNEIYIMRERNTSHHFNYSMDRFPVIFLGSGKYNDKKYQWFGANKKVKDLESGEYYYFKAAEVNRNTGKVTKVYMFGAYQWGKGLAIGSGANKISLYSFNAAAAKKLGVDK